MPLGGRNKFSLKEPAEVRAGEGWATPLYEYRIPAHIPEPSGPLRTSRKGEEPCAQLAIGVIAVQSQPEA